MSRISSLLFITSCLLSLKVCLGQSQFYDEPVKPSNEDEVTSLLGLKDKLNFKHYSGYLNADQAGGAPNNSFLHYWFFESQSNHKKAPLVVWFNGGPGCSSMLGLFNQLGPFELIGPGQLALRNTSWNKFANVLFLDSPIYVGYSYTKLGEWLVQDDDSMAKTNYLALQSFYTKFPRFKRNPLYLAGESYAAVYVATLGQLLDKDPKVKNFKGVAIGNGFLDESKSYLSLFLMAHHYGLFGKTKWDAFSQLCCNKQPPSVESCKYEVSTSACGDQTIELIRAILNSGVNPQNVYKDCVLDPPKGALKLTNRRACADDTLIVDYLNKPEVRTSLHVPSNLAGWKPCVPLFYDRKYVIQPGGLAPQISGLCDSKRNLTMLLYSGDLDLMANFMGAEWFADSLNRKLVREWIPWHVNKQVAGFVKHYQGLSFVTVKGAGHVAGQDKPLETATLIEKWLYPHKGKAITAMAQTDLELAH